MNKIAIKKLIALVFLLLFAGGISVSVIPNMTKESKWVSWQKEESEKDSSRTDTNNNTEVKEFVAWLFGPEFSMVLPVTMKISHRDAQSSFTRTCYLSVPTPPPDHM